jgi:APA family basic amino acid/polyamine antiporter
MVKSLGFWRCWALVVGSMIGNGIFMLPAVLAPYGSLSLLGWVCSGAGTLLLAFTFGRLARRLPKLGGPYAYVQSTFGDAPGFFVGWGHWISYFTASAAAAVAFVGYLGFFLPGLSDSAMLSALTGVGLIWLMTGVNISGVRSAGVIQLVTTLLKLLPLFVVAGGGFLLADVAAVPASNPDGEPLPTLIAGLVMITMWAYVGIENVTIPADDVIEPRKTIPRALIAGAISATLVYVIATMGVMALVPQAQLVESTSPFADAAVRVVGEWGASFVAIGALISIVGALNGNILATGMLGRAIALDALFPQRFERVNAGGAPVSSLIVSSILASLFIGMNYTRGLVAAFELLILLSTLTTLLPYALATLAEVVLQFRDKRQGLDLSRVSLVIALGAFIFSLFAIVGSGLEIAAYGCILLLAGVPVYLLTGKRRRALHESVTR